MIPRLLLIFIVILFSNKYISGQTERKIDFKANTVEIDKKIANGAKRLLGDVVFTHEGIVMNCDSAYYYSETNKFDAFSNISIRQGDSVSLFGDLLYYDGNTRIAQMRKNVRLNHNQTELTTNNLDYDINSSIGYYYDGGKVINGENNLVSKKGYYYTAEKTYFFKDSVVVTNPQYIINSDTLKYNTVTQTAFFFGPSEIIGDSNYIYCEEGWYNTVTDYSKLYKKAYIKNKEQYIRADTLYYDRIKGSGEGRNNVELIDSTQNVIIKGDFGCYNEITQTGYMTKHALLMEVYDMDTLYMHADTFRTTVDTLGNKIIKGYYKVKIYRSNLQGKCDSLVYLAKDSILQMLNEPVLWSEENQITGEKIFLFIKNNNISMVEIQNMAFIVSQEDSMKYNQIKGRNMVGYFKGNQLHRINVNGNGQTIYYAPDRDMIIGVNKAESSDLVIYLKDSHIDKINFINDAEATLYPLEMAPEDQLILVGCKWLSANRPLRKEDIFIWNEEINTIFQEADSNK